MSAKSKSEPKPDALASEDARLRGDLWTIGGRVSHDLLTPLGGILISVQLLRETLSRDEPSTSLAIDSLVSSVTEIKHLLESVSILAKATARPLPKERLSMEEIVLGVLERLESRISKRGAKVTGPDSWPEVEGVPGWLDFIWRSLLANALQHGGSDIRLGWAREKTDFSFFVSDNGSGVRPELRPQIFQTFDSLHGLDSRPGLGLSIVQRLVDLQGGRCFYQHNTGDGPRFGFTLPVSPA